MNFEERVAPSLGNVILEAVVDAEVDPPQHANRGPEMAAQKCAKQPRAMVRRKHASKDIARRLGRQFDGLNRLRPAAGIGNRGLAARPKIATQPPSPNVAWTNVRPSSTTMPSGTVRGLPVRRPRTAGVHSGRRSNPGRDHPAGEGLIPRRNRPAARLRRGSDVGARSSLVMMWYLMGLFDR